MPFEWLIYFNKAGKDVVCSESAKEIFTIAAYNLPYHLYGVGCEDRVLFFDGGFGLPLRR
jgi:hypothetical protein